jgi:hypothetical protein
MPVFTRAEFEYLRRTVVTIATRFLSPQKGCDLRFYCHVSRQAMRSSFNSHTRSKTPAAIAGVTRRLLWNARKAIPAEMERERGFEVVQLLAEGIGQPRKPAARR